MNHVQELQKELDIIQAVIGRMANNSFLLKGWTMTLVSGLIAFGKDVFLENSDTIVYSSFLILVIVPFWWLDSYYLKQERIFRKVYDRCVEDQEAKKRQRYDVKPTIEMIQSASSIRQIMFSVSTFWFYFPMIFLIFVVVCSKLLNLF